MRRIYMSYDPEQRLLLPQDLREWLPEEHLALFVSDVVEQLDLSKIMDWYERGDGRGRPPYHPEMMVKLLVYGYCTGRVSARKIEAATDEREDQEFGKGRRGDELPQELARRESRLQKIREAKAALEAEAKEKAKAAAAVAQAKLEARQKREEETGKKTPGRVPQVPD